MTTEAAVQLGQALAATHLQKRRESQRERMVAEGLSETEIATMQADAAAVDAAVLQVMAPAIRITALITALDLAFDDLEGVVR